LIDTVKGLENKVKVLSSAKAADSVGSIFDEAARCATPLKYAVKVLGELDKDEFARVADAVSDKISGDNLSDVVIVIGAEVDGKAMFAAGAGAGAAKCGIHCGELVKAAAKLAGGGGGGSPTRAQAGGKDAGKLGEAVAEVSKLITIKAGGK
jgi:alanyl-tRNA synthetase